MMAALPQREVEFEEGTVPIAVVCGDTNGLPVLYQKVGRLLTLHESCLGVAASGSAQSSPLTWS